MNTETLTTSWSKLSGDQFPKSFYPFIREKEVFKYPGDWIDAYYKGNVNNPEDIIIITTNGGFYKVGATFMVWSETFVLSYCQYEDMKKALDEFFTYNLDKPKRDPLYQS